MTSITQDASLVNREVTAGCTADDFAARQRLLAEAYAPEQALPKAEFVYRASFYPLDVIRTASVRYGPARGRTYAQVLERFVEHMRNPHLNRGDDLRIALGHIEATRRWMAEKAVL